MKIFLTFLTLSLSIKSFSQTNYVFYPEGDFTITVAEAGSYYFTGFQLRNGNIYSITENDYALYGTVQKLADISETYAVKLNSWGLFPYSSLTASLSSVDRYEIFDEQGILVGHIKGDFSLYAAESLYFFDNENGLLAKAILDPSHSEITIRSPGDDTLVICSKTFKYPGFTADPDYYWTIQQTPPYSFDARYLWPFVAFSSEVWWRNANMGGYN